MREAPIIESLIDMDFYKFTMCRLVWERMRRLGRSERVRYALICRTKDARLADRIDIAALEEQFAHVRGLRFWDDELAFLGNNPSYAFDAGFLDWLKTFSMPEILLERRGDGYRIEVEAPWHEAILWETCVLSIVNELYARGLVREQGLAPDELWGEGERRLLAKVSALKDTDVAFVDFGTRRRFSHGWQEHVVNVMSSLLPRHLIGVSDVGLAKRYGLPPSGTMGHELFMAYAALADGDAACRASQIQVLDDWRGVFGDALSVALTDTFGTASFFEDLRGDRAIRWRAIRHDSGDPFAFGERAIRFYEGEGIDPMTKTLVFSDGLDVTMILALHARFSGRIRTVFGWGTNLTNDLGLPPLSLVMKLVEAEGRPTVKLSDNPAKATGPDGEIGRYKRIFGYVEGERAECVY